MDDMDEVITKMMEGRVSKELIFSFKEAMKPHIGAEKELATEGTITSEHHNAIVGTYTQEEAQQWIREYMHTMCEALLPRNGEFVLGISYRIGISEDTIRGWYRDGQCPPAPATPE